MSVLFSLLRSRLLRPVFMALGVAMLVQVGLAVWLTRSIVLPLAQSLKIAQGVASGDLTGEISVTGSDEVTTLTLEGTSCSSFIVLVAVTTI